MRFTITHHGVPVGTVKFDPAEESVGLRVRPLPGYAAIRTIVRAMTTALRSITPGEGDSRVDTTALQRATELGQQLELRDEMGMLVPVDFIVLTEWPGLISTVVATLQLRDAHATVPALVQRPLVDGESAMDAPSV